MWERAVGVPASACAGKTATMTSRGLGGVRLGLTSEQLLRRAGQPQERDGRVWTWCVEGSANEGTRATAVLSPAGRVTLVASTAPGHQARGIGAAASGAARSASARLGRLARRPGTHFVYGVRRNRVTYVAVASRRVASSPERLRAHLRLARLR
jgi:hypothetical protein